MRIRATTLLLAAVITAPPVAHGQVYQALTSKDGTFNLGNWDGSRLLDEKTGKVLSTVTIAAGVVDFSRDGGESRSALLVRLYQQGLRVVHTSTTDSLFAQRFGALSPQGLQGTTAQILAENERGYPLVDWTQSVIADTNGTEIARMSVIGGQAALTPATGLTLAVLYDRGLRTVAVAPRRSLRLVADDAGVFGLRP